MTALTLSPVAHAISMMSSQEIASLTGKSHGNVIRDIRAMLDALRDAAAGDESNLIHQSREEKDARGYTSMFYLDRELTDTLLTGYSVVARRNVVRRWHQLEDEEHQRRVAERDRKQSRLEGKVTRKALQDVIATFIDYAVAQGSSNADWYYTSITTMEYKALGLVKQQGEKSFRDRLDGLTNTKLTIVEMVCQHSLADGMAQRLPYKAIFKLAQERLINMVSSLETSLPAPGLLRIEPSTHPPQKRHTAKGEGLNGGNRQSLGEAAAAATANASVTQNQ